jgi:hypothetical protein
VSLIGKGVKIMYEIGKYTNAIGDEEAMKKVHLSKQVLNVIPIAYPISKVLIPLVDPDLAKDMGNAISRETNRR